MVVVVVVAVRGVVPLLMLLLFTSAGVPIAGLFGARKASSFRFVDSATGMGGSCGLAWGTWPAGWLLALCHWARWSMVSDEVPSESLKSMMFSYPGLGKGFVYRIPPSELGIGNAPWTIWPDPC